VRALRVLLFLAAVVIAAAVAGWLFWSETEPDRTARRRGAALAAALRAGIGATAGIHAPHRCARLYPDELAPDVAAVVVDAAGSRAARRRGPILQLEPASDASLRLGVVADAHGALDALPGIRRAFARAGVNMVISLGGMGMERESIARALAALVADAGDAGGAGQGKAWLLLAMPGDWESIAEHRAAVAALADRGVIDGSEVRLIEVNELRLATLPGAPHPSRLMTGHEGCVFTSEDAADIAKLLSEQPGARLLFVHPPPRQGAIGLPTGGASPTDAGHTAISMGERALADVLRATPVDAVIHGLVGAPGQPGGGRALASDTPVILAAGILDPLHGLATAALQPDSPGIQRPMALIAEVTAERIAWKWVAPEKQ
jgi:hypothetical protein